MDCGVLPGAFWLASALRFIDFRRKDLINETIFINQVLPGAFSYTDLKNMAFSDYEEILNRVKDIANGR